jgi:hypothetical protein
MANAERLGGRRRKFDARYSGVAEDEEGKEGA